MDSHVIVEIKDVGASPYMQYIWEGVNAEPWPGFQPYGAGGLCIVCAPEDARRFVRATKDWWFGG